MKTHLTTMAIIGSIIGYICLIYYYPIVFQVTLGMSCFFLAYITIYGMLIDAQKPKETSSSLSLEKAISRVAKSAKERK